MIVKKRALKDVCMYVRASDAGMYLFVRVCSKKIRVVGMCKVASYGAQVQYKYVCLAIITINYVCLVGLQRHL